MDKESLEEILGRIYESTELKVIQIEGLTNALRFMEIENNQELISFGPGGAIEAILNSIDDAANNTLFNNIWDAEHNIKLLRPGKDNVSELKVGKDGISTQE